MILALSIIVVLSCCTTDYSTSLNYEVVQQQFKIAPNLKTRAKTFGIVRLIVSLNLEAEGVRLAPDTAMDRLLSELHGTTYKIVRRVASANAIILTVGPDALEVLNNSRFVNRVDEDKEFSFSHLSYGIER